MKRGGMHVHRFVLSVFAPLAGLTLACRATENRSKRGVVARRRQGNQPTVADGKRSGVHLE